MEFPPCPESLAPIAELFSELQMQMVGNKWITKNGLYKGGAKLISHMMPRKNYALHTGT